MAATFESDGATKACYASADDEDMEGVGSLGKGERVIVGVHLVVGGGVKS